ncbi:uncharacterized protein [Chironomus tepperi]|uniref:uncharacterized protein n=1 Tax=Chironomus tepperi TaxID=113505 RepID=UPI00391FAF7B
MQSHHNQENSQQTQLSGFCNTPPIIIFLLITLIMTTSATSMLCAAFLTDHWENIMWDSALIDIINRTDSQTFSNKYEFLLDEKVVRLPLKSNPDYGGVFFVPMHGGIWSLCINLKDIEIKQLRPKGFPNVNLCYNYLTDNSENTRNDDTKLSDWQHVESQSSLQPHLRMQNLSISCALVCLIILGSAALIGAFGVCQRQISAILVTGVMYLLAALFALFTLMIIHFKRQKGKTLLASDYDGTVEGIQSQEPTFAQNLLDARIFATSWSLDLGWGGVVLCALASFLWIFLSKLMRFTPVSHLI